MLHITYKFLRIAIPTIFSCLFLELIYFINAVFAGGLDDAAKLAGVGLGTVFINMICLHPLIGMNGAVETLVSLAFGANELVLCGTYLNRGRIINTCIFIPLIAIILNARPILSAIG